LKPFGVCSCVLIPETAIAVSDFVIVSLCFVLIAEYGFIKGFLVVSVRFLVDLQGVGEGVSCVLLHCGHHPCGVVVDVVGAT
jgi:hypothetical protein